MENLVKCAKSGKKPRVQPANQRAGWKVESISIIIIIAIYYAPLSLGGDVMMAKL